MPLPTPFHPYTAPLCESYDWRNWSGYLAAGLYEPSHEREYYAVRNSAGLIDISPLYKYEITGPDALRLVDRIMTRDMTKCRVGQVMYSPWCDEKGQIIDDGTIARLAETHFRITSADPNLRWFQDVGYGLQAQVVNVSSDLAALALQGPNSRAILQEVVTGIDFSKLNYFHLAQGQVNGVPVTVTRTGYTGDLGYELWVRPDQAEPLWTALLDRGTRYGLMPVGLAVLDMVRIEAGLLLIEVDYISAHKALIESQKSSPYELGLGWTVKLDRSAKTVGADFIGRRALALEKERGSQWAFVGLRVQWEKLERLYAQVDLPPQVAGQASRDALPLYKFGRQIGQVTSHTFSPILKEYIGIGPVLRPHAQLGGQVSMEFTIEYKRQRVPATIVRTPFFDPPRKRG